MYFKQERNTLLVGYKYIDFIFRREICCWSGTNPFIAFSAEEKYIVGPKTNPFIVFSGEKYIVGRVQMVWLFPSLISERGTHCCG